jgi:hypothetical protein
MNVKTEQDITPEVALELRNQSGLSQREFWEGVGSNQSSGHWFENNKRKSIPKPIRTLIFLRHVAHMPVSVSDEDSAAAVVKYGTEVAAKIEAERLKEAAAEAERKAKEAQQKVKKLAA